MSAVWMRARAELRRRWVAWLVLATLLGVAGGASIAAAAGARRTSTAYPRMLRQLNAMDLVMTGLEEDPDPVVMERAYDEVLAMPQVADAAFVSLIDFVEFVAPNGAIASFPDVFPLVSFDDRFGRELNARKYLAGRAANPARAEEVVVNLFVAERLSLRPGDTLALRRAYPGPKLPFDQVRVVGVAISPGEFQSLSGATVPAFHLTQAFKRAFPDELIPKEVAIRLHGGTAAVPAFRAEVERRGLPLSIGFDFAQQGADVQRSTRFEEVALWSLAGLIALSAVAILGQAFARQTAVEAAEHPTLRALGMSAGDLFLSGLVRATAVTFFGCAISVVVAWLLSPLAPIGVGRLAEPSLGPYFDAAAIAAGAAVLLLASYAMSAVPLAKYARARQRPDAPRRASALAGAAAEVGLPPTVVSGLRFALYPGRGVRTVPVRSAIAGAALGAFALVATLSFRTSFDELIERPELSGFTFDAGFGSPERGPVMQDVLRHAGVARSAEATFVDISLGGRGMTGFGLDTGSIPPAMIEGVPPRAEDEIAVGAATAERLRAGIGDSIQVTWGGGGGRFNDSQGPAVTKSFRITGYFVMPTLTFQLAPPGEGAVLSLAGRDRLVPREAQRSGVFVRFAPGIAVQTGVRLLREKLPPETFVLARTDRGDLANFQRVAQLPIVLACVVVFLGGATFVHALATSVRRRRGDLAVLKTLGFVPAQVRATVSWQASALMFIALAAGVPLGVIVGRWSWTLFVRELFLIPAPIVPVASVCLVIAAGFVVANVVAMLPGRAAAATRPAVALRAE